VTGAPAFVHGWLSATARRTPDKTAIIAGNRKVSFAELDRDSDTLAATLQGCGVRRGDRVALFMDNSTELATGIFAVLKAGAVLVIVNSTTKSDKLAYLLDDCGVSIVIAQGQLATVVAAAAPLAPTVAHYIWADEGDARAPTGMALGEILTGPPRVPVAAGLIDADLCGIMYTSGSTGHPKGVMLTHRNMTNTAWSISTYLGNVPEDVVLTVLPLAFGYGLSQVLTAARVGFTLVLEKSFAFPFEAVKRMAEHRVTGLPGMPTIYARLLQIAAFSGQELPALRYMTNAAAALPPSHIRRLQALFPSTRIFSMYGLTECTRACYLEPERLADKIGSVGKAIPNSEMFVVDDEGNRAPSGVVGELVIRGANVMRGYWGKPDETTRRLRDGDVPGEKWLYSGDQFYMDEEGFAYFVGRTDEVFKCRGEKVSPTEIEQTLYALPDVAEAAVVGVEDPVDGMAIHAFVALREGAKLTETAIRHHCRAHLESHLVPKYVELRSALPKTYNGKIYKKGILAAEVLS
jgi:amino acid adenylation domain-containing protein